MIMIDLKLQEMKTKIWFVLVTWELLFDLCGAVSQRKIYTLFTNKKTWNEGRDICESQRGQLVKIKSQMQIEELRYLDSIEWGNRMTTALPVLGVWTSLHMPFTNTTWTYQDCEPISSDVAVSLSGDVSAKCAKIEDGYIMKSDSCNEEKMFICQRFEGDCWYEPFFEEIPNVFSASSPDVQNVTDASLCALQCRNYYDTVSRSECWGFTFYPAHKLCILHEDNSPAASSNYLKSSNREAGPADSTFYIRRCFEGTLDDNTYDSVQDENLEPDSICSTTPYSTEATAADVCYCSTKEHPPIPAPTSSEEKAAQYAKELSIDSGNLSAAMRKLTSAEDNRASAVGVGYVGVGLLTAVFGGLFLLDLNVLLAGLKSLVCSTENAVVNTDSDC